MLLVILGSVVALGLGAAITFYPSQTSTAGANPDDPVQISQGRAVYAENCASCHGPRLEGQSNWRARKPDGRLPAPPHDETGHTWHHPDEHLFNITKDGSEAYAPLGYKSDMSAFGQLLTDQQIWAVLAFIKSTWPPQIRQVQERFNQ